MSCNIFKKPLLLDISDPDSIVFDINWLSGLIPEYDHELDGIWQPIWVTYDKSNTSGVELLYPVRNTASKSFSVCNCEDAQISPDPLYQEESIIGLCDYCGNPPEPNPTATPPTPPIEWKLYDNNGNSSARSYNTSCCSGGCDTMLKVDDYIPKIPYLNNAYITGLCDWKHKLQFPACNNKPLGCEGFITVDTLDTIRGVSLKIDWRIQETISEIPYDTINSQHDTKHMHEVSYTKSRIVSSTCGNFIMTSLPLDPNCPNNSCTEDDFDNREWKNPNFYSKNYPIFSGLIFSNLYPERVNQIIPSIDDFQKLPYGFDQETYNNIFIQNQKLGSYWKWNYTSGILCWYRYYNSGIPDDKRPIPGIDLYISPGDFFYAENDGPEPGVDMTNPTGMIGSIKSCPSGLKLLKGSTVTGIIPSGSQFAYISANIYERFHNLYYKLLDILNTPENINNNIINNRWERSNTYQYPYMYESDVDKDIAKVAFNIAGILATGPQYDEIIVDLFKRSPLFDYAINDYGQLDSLNKIMQKETEFDSVSRLNYISNKQELLNTLANKYGAYLWVPPNSTKNITFASSLDTTFAIDLNFNLSFKNSDTFFSSATCRPMTNCNTRSINKNFSYEQDIGYGQGKVRTITNEKARHANSCLSGNITASNFGLYSNIYYNESLIKSVFTSNGCSILSGIYPRISEMTTSNFCTNCDPYSSFYLISNAEVVECGNYDSTDSFCYATLARRFNNSPPQFPGDRQNRIERSLADGTKRWVRSYPSLFFNPYIDSVAFHQNNGVFINSPPFKLDSFAAFEFNTTTAGSSSNIYVGFNTKDVGIKIYSLSAEYLQTSSSSTYGCKRFPVNNTCKCLPIISPDILNRPIDCDNPNPQEILSSNVFTPGLSTRYAPRLKQYGGFSQKYLDSIFGDGVITAGGTVPVLSSYTNPKTPEGCNSTASITLHNYTNTIWELSVQGKNPNAELYVTINEDIDLLGPRYKAIYNIDYTKYEPIVKSKRFATKVTINNDITLYAGQTSPIEGDTTSFTVKLQNPFLSAAIQARGGDPGTILYPPSGNLQNAYVFSKNGITKIGDTQRGDETSPITLTFSQKFNSHKLLFKIPPLQPMGTLKEGFFDPNKGLIDTPNGNTPVSGGILYTRELTNVEWPQGKNFYGDINNRAINVINSLNEFDHHKKLRLYIQSNNKWYKYTGSNTGCFTINNIKYPGSPIFFEYNTEINTKHLPGFLLTPVRKHIDFNFIRNFNFNNGFPLDFDQRFNVCSIKKYGASDPSQTVNTTVSIPGIRAYFLIPEKDPAIVTNLESIEDIGSFVPNYTMGVSDLAYGSTIVFNDDTHWICINPSEPNLRSSYLYSEFSYLYHYFSDTHVKFDKVNKEGYVYNTKKPCSCPIRLFTTDNSFIDDFVLEKSLYVEYKNKNGGVVQDFNTEDIYIQPYTLLKLQVSTLPPNTKLRAFDPFVLYPLNTAHSLLLGQINAPIAENNPLINNNYIPGKWGDVINYNGRLVDSIVGAQYPIDEIYPKSTYNNLFQQIVINNHSKYHVYKITDKNNETFAFTGIRDADSQVVYYSILHKYGIGDNTNVYSPYTDRYHNFIPLIDVNLLNITVPVDPMPGSGIINIGGVTYTSQPDEGYEPYASGKFWINFSVNDSMEATFVPVSDFYTETLRIDQPVFWLNNTTRNTRELTPNITYRRRFEPNNITNYNASTSVFDNSSSYKMKTINRNQPFWVYPIYGDRDDGTCDNSGCFQSNDHGLARAADLELKANYKIAEETTQSVGNGNISYALGYDAGIYNIIGNDSLVQIKRFSLKSNNSIDNTSDSCSSAFILPSNYKLSSSTPIFQNTILDTNISTPLSYPIDAVANEMLFRILYGQEQYVNREMYFIDKPIYNKQDIINYSDPRITAEDIYSQILYNYDKNATSNFNLNGSFVINGVATVGSTTTLTIDDLTITIVIENRSGNIYAVATSNISIPYFGNKLEVLLYSGVTNSSSYIIQNLAPDADPPPPEPPDNNTTIVYRGECLYYDSYQYYQVAFGYELPDVPNVQNMVSISTTCGVDWSNAYGDASMGQGGDCCCGPAGPCGGGCVELSVTSWGPIHLRQCVCAQPQVGAVGFIAPVTRERPVPCNGLGYAYGIGSGPCTPFDVGYCRKADCETCAETLQEETSIDFEYEWQYCRTNFSLFGHIYRQVHQFDGSPIIVQPRPPDCYDNSGSSPGGDACGNYPPGLTTDGGGPTTTCITYPVIGLTRDEQDDLRKNNMLIGVTQGIGYNCPDQSNGYVPPVPIAVCVPVYGAGSPCEDGSQACLFQGCPTPFSSLSPSQGCSVGNCDFCYTPDSSYTAPCDDIDSGFEYPSGKCDKYCHFCGVGRTGTHDVISKNRLYLSTTTTTNPAYNPLCASTLCTVSYSSSAITLTIGGKSMCFSRSLLRCPRIRVNSTMSQLSLTDNIESSCDQCLSSALKVFVPEQRQAFVTKTESRRCLLATFTACSVNSPGVVSGGWQAYEHHAFWALKCGGGEVEYGCGELGGLVYGNSDLLYSVTYECLKGLACSMSSTVASYEVPETQWRLANQMRSRYQYLTKGSNHIPVEDIIEGIIPGSVSDVIMESFNSGGVSITRTGAITNDVSTTYAFYFTYNYIRPVTIQDIMRNDDNIICTADNFQVNTNNTYHHCSMVPFPSAYASNLDGYQAYRFNINKTGHIEGASYTHTHPTYYQASNCDGGISCYYKHKVFICGTADFCCMSDLGVVKNEGIELSCNDTNAPFPSEV